MLPGRRRHSPDHGHLVKPGVALAKALVVPAALAALAAVALAAVPPVARMLVLAAWRQRHAVPLW